MKLQVQMFCCCFFVCCCSYLNWSVLFCMVNKWHKAPAKKKQTKTERKKLPRYFGTKCFLPLDDMVSHTHMFYGSHAWARWNFFFLLLFCLSCFMNFFSIIIIQSREWKDEDQSEVCYLLNGLCGVSLLLLYL